MSALVGDVIVCGAVRESVDLSDRERVKFAAQHDGGARFFAFIAIGEAVSAKPFKYTGGLIGSEEVFHPLRCVRFFVGYLWVFVEVVPKCDQVGDI
tara:strand:- start:5057 stop:5344 length:288 start_codon:yes stop_codon:yes gene_type:complete